MSMNISKSILRSILTNKKAGTKITSQKFEKLKVWAQEINPYLEKLQNMGYIEDYRKSKQTQFTIKKPISINTINKL